MIHITICGKGKLSDTKSEASVYYAAVDFLLLCLKPSIYSQTYSGQLLYGC